MRCAAALLVLVATRAEARPLRLAIADDAACPSRAQVMGELTRLAPGLQLAAADAEDAVAASIEDLGDRYRVRTLEDKEIADADRRCDERARVASLLIALALETPRVVPTPPPYVAPSPLPVGAIYAPRAHLADWGPLRPRAQAFIDRPLVLERGRVELQASFFADSSELRLFEPGAIDNTDSRRNIDGAAALSIEVGLGGRTQLGVVAAMPIRAGIDAGAVIASAMVSLHKDVALRASIGWERDPVDPTASFDARNALFVSVALPFRHRFHRWLSIVGGDPGLRPIWFSSEPAVDSVFLPTRMTTFNDALFSMRKGPGWFEGTVYTPIGDLFQLHRMVMLALQLGPRLAFDQRRFQAERSAVVGSLTLLFSPSDRVDLGLSLDADLVSFTVDVPMHTVNGAFFARVRL